MIGVAFDQAHFPVFDSLEDRIILGNPDDFPVLVTSKSNPLAGKKLTKSEIAMAPHVAFRAFRTFKAAYFAAAEENGIHIDPIIEVTDAMDIPSFIAGTDLVAPMPSRMAMKFSSMVGIAHPPFRGLVDGEMYWAASANQNQLNAWMRGLIREEIGNVEPPHSL